MFTHLRFADDVIIAKSGNELIGMAEDLKKGLSINFSKSKVMSNISALGEVKINKEKIEQVIEYRYLG